jgi:glycosyltransferase involved in cell wall biosynthesis
MLMQQLQRRGHQVKVISLPKRGYFGSLIQNFASSIYGELLNSKIDILLQDELCHSSLFLLNTRLRGRVTYPIISIVHMLRSNPSLRSPLRWLFSWVESKYLGSVDGLIFNSKHTKKLVDSTVGGRRPYVIATPGGDRFRSNTSTREIRARAKRSGPLHVLFLGNLTRNKSAHVLIAALTKLELGSVYVTLAGRDDVEPGYTRFLKSQIRRAEVDEWVHFAGHLEGELLEATLRTAQILVVPSSYEGFGISYLEGMSFGLPAIGSRSGGTEEIIRHGKNGYLIRVGDSEELTALLKRLHLNREMLTKLSINAQRTFRAFPTWRESMERIHTFLNRYNESTSPANSPRRKK